METAYKNKRHSKENENENMTNKLDRNKILKRIHTFEEV